MKKLHSDRNTLLYLIPLFIWGSTWIIIKMQLGVVDPLVSVVYRFLLASAVLLGFLMIRRKKLRFSLREHLFFLILGIILFGINYWFVYEAEEVVMSGLIALIFSSIVFFNSINGKIFLKLDLRYPVLIGGLLGVFGICMVFINELLSISFDKKKIFAYFLGIAGAYIASLGNVFSYYIQKKKRIPVLQATAFGMFYGAISMLFVVITTGRSFNFDFSFKYIFSLFYLSVFGSIIAFTAYLTVIGRIGADKAGNAVLAAPVLAIFLSTFFENLKWSSYMTVGVIMVIIGNYIALRNYQEKVIQK